MVQSHTENEFCPSMGVFKSPVFNFSWKMEAPNICSVRQGESNFDRGSFSLTNLTTSLENLWALNAHSALVECSISEAELFTLWLWGEWDDEVSTWCRFQGALQLFLCVWGFRCYKRNWQELIYFFLYKCDKIMVENKTGLQGLTLFSQRLFIANVLIFLFVWFLTVSTVVYIRCFVKRKQKNL